MNMSRHMAIVLAATAAASCEYNSLRSPTPHDAATATSNTGVKPNSDGAAWQDVADAVTVALSPGANPDSGDSGSAMGQDLAPAYLDAVRGLPDVAPNGSENSPDAGRTDTGIANVGPDTAPSGLQDSLGPSQVETGAPDAGVTDVRATAAPDGSPSLVDGSDPAKPMDAIAPAAGGDANIVGPDAPGSARLVITSAGTGGGSVTSTPDGISCGASCAADFGVETVVTLSASPDMSSTFTGWSGACSGTGTCTVTMDAAKSVTARFDLVQYALAVSKTGAGAGAVVSSPSGITCGATCGASFVTGAVVSLTATADGGSVFTGWSGACVGTGTCVVTMTSAKSVAANFDVVHDGLNVAKAGTGSGTVTSSPAGISCGSTCAASLAAGTLVTLTASPDGTSTFAGWSGACSGTGTCTVTMDAAKSVTASFDMLRYSLAVSKSGAGSGTVASSPAGIDCGSTCSASFTTGAIVTLTATAAPASLFTGWSGACAGTATCSVTMSATKAVTANFIASAWTSSGPLAVGRSSHTATPLPSGQVLVAGGYNGGVLASAELYAPSNGTFSSTASMATPRRYHTATLLDSGKVLIVGGQSDSGNSSDLSSAELYDPASGTFASTGSLAIARFSHTATLLPSGKVLVSGGVCWSTLTLDYSCITAELYDPATGTFSATGSLTMRRDRHTATLLPSGKVMVAGGYQRCCFGTLTSQPLATAEVYDPGAGTWTSTASLSASRYNHTATLLSSGKVLVLGGSNGGADVGSGELYDPASGTFVSTGSLAVARTSHTATLLPSGKVLIVAGYDVGAYLTSVELYDPLTGVFSAATSIANARALHTATFLSSGKVLVVGGSNGTDLLKSAEIYDPGN